MKASEEELLEAVKNVLAGAITREDVAGLEAEYKAYIGVALMLACGYQLTQPGNVVTGSMARALSTLTQTGLTIRDRRFVMSDTLREQASALGLHERRPGKQTVRLTPPLRLLEYVQRYADTEALARYMQGVDKDYKPWP